MIKNHTIIAFDGVAASGKGTIARAIALHYHYAYLDTGLLYRKLAWLALQKQAIHAIDIASFTSQLDKVPEEKLGSEEIGEKASVISAYPEVRAALLSFQRQFAAFPGKNFKGAVLDGRDIGTVICPEAPLKFFVDAPLATRAARRFQQLTEQGIATNLQQIQTQIAQRDNRDRNRLIAPLKAAPDAHIIINDQDLDQTLSHIYAIIDRYYTSLKVD